MNYYLLHIKVAKLKANRLWQCSIHNCLGIWEDLWWIILDFKRLDISCYVLDKKHYLTFCTYPNSFKQKKSFALNWQHMIRNDYIIQLRMNYFVLFSLRTAIKGFQECFTIWNILNCITIVTVQLGCPSFSLLYFAHEIEWHSTRLDGLNMIQ